MASQLGQLGGLPAHSGAETALSGANTVSQDDGVAVDSPWVTHSQASVALAGETNPLHAAGSTAHTSARFAATDSALSVRESKGRKRKAEGVQHPAHSSSLNDAAPSTASHAVRIRNSQQQGVLPAPQQECGSPTDAAAGTSEPSGQLPQSPLPHCNLPSIQRRPSAAMSVEAVQQDGDDDNDQGALASNQVGGGVTSLPTASTSRRHKPASPYSILPVAPASWHRSPALHEAAANSAVELEHSGLHNSEYQQNPQSPASQQLSGVLPTQHSRTWHRPDSGDAMLVPQPSLVAAECSGASESHPNLASQHDTCQAAPETTQQATIEEALSGQQYDEEAQQSAYISNESHGQMGTSPSVSVGVRAADAANSPASQRSHAAAKVSAATQHSGPAQAYATGTCVNEQQQTTASNDGLVTAGSYDTLNAAAASVHATALEEDLPASDAETDLSSVGRQHGRRGRMPMRQRPFLPNSADSAIPEVPAQSASICQRPHLGNSQATSQRQL